MIILLSGKQGAGKTTLAEQLIREWEGPSIRLKYADPLYALHDIVREVASKYGLSPVCPKDGTLLQLLGTEWGRKIYGEDVWVRCLQNTVSRYDQGTNLIIIDDCRFPNEFEAFPNALRVRLSAPREVRKERCTMWRDNDTHASETALDAHEAEGKFDLVLDTSVLVPELCVQTILDHINKKMP